MIFSPYLLYLICEQMDRRIVLIVWLILFLSNSRYIVAAILEKFVDLNGSILLDCTQQDGKTKWEHDGDVIYTGTVNVGSLPRGTTELLQNNSLQILCATVDHDGLYKCISGDRFVVYQVTVTGL